MLCKIVLLAVLSPGAGAKKKKPRSRRLPCYEVHLSLNTPLVLEDKYADGGEERGDADPHAYLSDTVVVVG